MCGAVPKRKRKPAPGLAPISTKRMRMLAFGVSPGEAGSSSDEVSRSHPETVAPSVHAIGSASRSQQMHETQ